MLILGENPTPIKPTDAVSNVSVKCMRIFLSLTKVKELILGGKTSGKIFQTELIPPGVPPFTATDEV